MLLPPHPFNASTLLSFQGIHFVTLLPAFRFNASIPVVYLHFVSSRSFRSLLPFTSTLLSCSSCSSFPFNSSISLHSSFRCNSSLPFVTSFLSFQNFPPVRLPLPFVSSRSFHYIFPFVSTRISRVISELKKLEWLFCEFQLPCVLQQCYIFYQALFASLLETQENLDLMVGLGVLQYSFHWQQGSPHIPEPRTHHSADSYLWGVSQLSTKLTISAIFQDSGCLYETAFDNAVFLECGKEGKEQTDAYGCHAINAQYSVRTARLAVLHAFAPRIVLAMSLQKRCLGRHRGHVWRPHHTFSNATPLCLAWSSGKNSSSSSSGRNSSSGGKSSLQGIRLRNLSSGSNPSSGNNSSSGNSSSEFVFGGGNSSSGGHSSSGNSSSEFVFRKEFVFGGGNSSSGSSSSEFVCLRGAIIRLRGIRLQNLSS